ncbi:MAG: hypothetical protein LBT79_03375 [Elusimicrobiota bacterium]|jgi:hypothetical protein|nr:hypothetical protein [Elusimicrobiota bacterium]
MKQMKKVMFLTLVLAFCAANAFALVKDDPIMIKGIRPMGMGGAFVAVADDENAVFYNPAGITQRTSWLLQVLSINAAVNTETLQVINDANDTFKDTSGMSIDTMEKTKDKINDKDIDIALTLPNFFFISSPIEIGSKGNTLSFGLGEFSSLTAGANINLELPHFVLELAKVTEQNGAVDPKDIVVILPIDILQDFGNGTKTDDELRNLLERIQNGGADADVAYDELYDNFLDADGKEVVDELKTGDKTLEDVIDKIEDKHPNILGSVGASGVINTYATVTADIPVAYRFKSLDAIKLPGELSVGANLKYIYRLKAYQYLRLSVNDVGDLEKSLDTMNIAAVTGSGFGLDLGTIYHYNERLNLGLQISDLFTRIDYNNVTFKKSSLPDSAFAETAYIATTFNIGAAYTPETIYYWKDKYFETNNRFTFAADIRDLFGAYESDFIRRFHIGGEYRYSPFALRLGLNKFYPSFGAGIEVSWFQLSYAFYGDESYLAKQLGQDKTVWYHEIQISFKFGHFDGKPFGNDVKKAKTSATTKAQGAQQ